MVAMSAQMMVAMLKSVVASSYDVPMRNELTRLPTNEAAIRMAIWRQGRRRVSHAPALTSPGIFPACVVVGKTSNVWA